MKKLKKLDFNSTEISNLTADESKNVSGGLFKSRVLCFSSNEDNGCTSHTRCNDDSEAGVTIFCVEI